MQTSAFHYDLPKKLIAQHPSERRDQSRLLQLSDGLITDRHFYDLPALLKSGDLLVLNDTKVLPARLYGKKLDSGAEIEILLLKQMTSNISNNTREWKVLAKPARRLKLGSKISFLENRLEATVIGEEDKGIRYLRFYYVGLWENLLDEAGVMPLPPYIHESLKDKNRYQTVYAQHDGSAAAPTAGLHFTTELLEVLKNKGIEIVYVTLHVGLGTFRPVQVEDIAEHKMHSEYYELSEASALSLNRAKQEQRRVIAVGTTACRVLETVASDQAVFSPKVGNTDIFIYPGYKFKAIDALITNFHLPESSLIMLVSAFAGYENIMKAYKYAVEKEYRFFSFGDAMFIEKASTEGLQ